MGPHPDYINFHNLTFIERLSEEESVPSSWRHFFAGMSFAHKEVVKEESDLRVFHLIAAYRRFGHLIAECNPLEQGAPKEIPELSLKQLHFQDKELKAFFPTYGLMERKSAPLE